MLKCVKYKILYFHNVICLNTCLLLCYRFCFQYFYFFYVYKFLFINLKKKIVLTFLHPSELKNIVDVYQVCTNSDFNRLTASLLVWQSGKEEVTSYTMLMTPIILFLIFRITSWNNSSLITCIGSSLLFPSCEMWTSQIFSSS